MVQFKRFDGFTASLPDEAKTDVARAQSAKALVLCRLHCYLLLVTSRNRKKLSIYAHSARRLQRTTSMEPLNDISKSGLDLPAFPIEVLDQIIWFAGDNASLKLIFSGNRRIVAKVSRSSTLSLRWESSAFYDWSRCSALWKSFSNLKYLRLSTWSPTLLGVTTWKRELFPPKLRHLSVLVFDAYALMEPSCDVLHNLIDLDVLILHSQLRSTSPIITFANLPSSLRTLRFTSDKAGPSPSECYFNYQEAFRLPPNLETFHIDAVPIENGGKARPFRPPPVLASFGPHLTTLSLVPSGFRLFAVQPIAHQLRRLEACLEQPSIFELSPAFQVDFPLLEAIQVWFMEAFEWSQLRYLPPSVTELTTSFKQSNLNLDAIDTCLATMNDTYLRHGRHLDHPAPMNLRLVANVHQFNPIHPSIMHHFPSVILPEVNLTSCANADTIAKLPKKTLEVTISTPQVDLLTRLPNELQALNWSWKPKQSMMSFSRDWSLPHLTRLQLDIPLPTELISLLPSSLQELRIKASLATLALLSHHCIVGPLTNLRTLGVSVFDSALGGLDASLFPTTLTKLKLRHSSSMITSTFCHMPCLEILIIDTATDALSLFRSLPPSLKVLNVELLAPFDLAILEHATELNRLKDRVPRLKSLTVRTAFIKPLYDNNTAPSLSFSEWRALPPPIRRMYAERTLGLVNRRTLSEYFVFSSLPRELSELKLHAWSHQVLYVSRSDAPLLAYIWESMIIPWSMYQMPLLGLCMTAHSEIPYEDDPLRLVAPPHLSSVQGCDTSTHCLELNYMHASGRWPSGQAYERPLWPSPVECALHITNIAMLLLIPATMPHTWSNTPWLRVYLWATMLGSVIGLPLSIMRYRRARSMKHSAMASATSWSDLALRFTVGALGCSISGLLIGLTAMTLGGDYSLSTQVLTLVGASAYSFVRNKALTLA